MQCEGLDDLLAGHRVDAPVGQGGSHHRQVGGTHQERALPGVDVGGLVRVGVEPAVALEQVGDALVAQVGGGLRRVDARDRVRADRPAKRDRPSRMNSHRSSLVAPGTRLVVAMAPALTIGFIVRSSFNSMAITELKASPVALTPSSRWASS